MSRTHELKTDPDAFEAMRRGVKTCEIRKDDRDYMVGDVLVLRETLHSAEAMCRNGWPLGYTGRSLTRTVSHVLVGYGLRAGHVALSFAPPAGVRRTLECAHGTVLDRCTDCPNGPYDNMAEDARDAARYRWLRDKSEPNICAFYLSVGMALHGVKFKPETVDEAIDAAMKAENAVPSPSGSIASDGGGNDGRI